MQLANWPRLVEALSVRQIDAVIATTPANVTYLSDFWSVSHWTRSTISPVFAVAVHGDERNVGVVIPAGNGDLIGANGAVPPQHALAYGRFFVEPGAGDHAYSEEDRDFKRLLDAVPEQPLTPVGALVELLGRLGLTEARLAIEAQGVHPRLMSELEAALPKADLVAEDDLLREVRIVKTEREIELLRRAATTTEDGIATALSAVQTGQSELDFYRGYLSAISLLGATSLTASITSGPRTAMSTGQPTDRLLGPGDVIRFDGGCRVGHYASDIARCAVLGEASDKADRYYRAVSAGLEAAIETAGPGVRASACFEAAVQATRDAGIPHYRRTHCGHGIGIENYDKPSITAASDEVLLPGMVLCLETPYYELGWGGVQAEDTICITEEGVDRFTYTPRELPRIP